VRRVLLFALIVYSFGWNRVSLAEGRRLFPFSWGRLIFNGRMRNRFNGNNGFQNSNGVDTRSQEDQDSSHSGGDDALGVGNRSGSGRQVNNGNDGSGARRSRNLDLSDDTNSVDNKKYNSGSSDPQKPEWMTDAEWAAVVTVNQARAQMGKRPLAPDENATLDCRKQATEMANGPRNGQDIWHTAQSYLNKVFRAENVAMNPVAKDQSGAYDWMKNALAHIHQYMNSSGHRQNIANAQTRVGVGIVTAQRYGREYSFSCQQFPMDDNRQQLAGSFAH
jgi:uncharacterized protein YkwD